MNAKKYSYLLLLPALLIFSGCGQAPGAALSGEEDMDTTPLKIVESGKSLQCTYTAEAQGVTMTGTYFVDGPKGKFRMDGEATVGSMKITTYMIGDKENVYSWSDVGGKTGMKMAIDKTAKTDKANGGTDTSGVDEKMKFKCKGWWPDAAKFALPTDIKFTDYGAK